jgi:glycosyltransferase involved in cell wall biosynthesis
VADVSVLIPVFNGARFLAAAIESAAAQTLRALEIIVVDDGSTDGSAEVAKRTGRARVIEQPNRGPGAARNRAVAEARGDHLAFLDADDLWKPSKLERQSEALARKPEAGWFVCRHEFLLDEGEARPRWAPAPEAEATMIAWLPSALLVRRDVFAATRGFDEEIRYGEDIDWFARARDAGFPGDAVEEQLLVRRVHKTNMMHQHQQTDFQRAIATILMRRRKSGAR